MLRDLKDFVPLADLAEKACLLYLENGTPDTATIALERAAKYEYIGIYFHLLEQ